MPEPGVGGREEEYRAHLLAGGAPFGEPFNATIREAVDAYREIIADLTKEAPDA